MELEAALNKAIEYETEVEGVYREAAEKVANPEGRKALETLAREEGYHVDFLRRQLENLAGGGALETEKLATRLPGSGEIRAGLERLQEKLDPSPDAHELEVLRQALNVERQTALFYKQMAREFTGEREQAFFERFCEIEEGHLNLVQAEMDAITKTGVWFDFLEFDLEGEKG